MKLRGVPFALTLVVLIAACGAGPSLSSSTTSSVETSTTTTPLPAEGVEVVITATPVLHEDGSIELCPPGMTGACPGIALQGQLPDDLLSTPEQATFIEVTGSYDGASITPSADPVAIDYPPTDYTITGSLCSEMQGSPSVNPDNDLTQAIASYVAGQPDYAATWWDRETSILTVWFASEDVSEHETAIAELAGEEPVCVAGGARFSEADLLEASQLLNEVRDSRGLPLATFGYGLGGTKNWIEMPLEELDAATRTVINDLVGDRVVLYPFLELTEAPLTELPDPITVVEGDVEILTSRIRTGGGMDALGQFEIAYDADLNCVYFSGSEEGDGGRTAPVWPFGYSATSDPMTVYDYDGNVLANEGDTVELGGGYVDAEFVDGNTCGAEGAWIVNR